MKYKAIVMGASAGGFEALCRILPRLPRRYALPMVIVQHRRFDGGCLLEHILDFRCMISVKQAGDKDLLCASNAYFAPPNYHLMIEDKRTLALSTGPPVCNCRPSIDVLFESAADIFGDQLIGVVLTGANTDGCNGAQRLKQCGGLLIVQDPSTASASTMPAAVLQRTTAEHILALDAISDLLLQLQSV